MHATGLDGCSKNETYCSCCTWKHKNQRAFSSHVRCSRLYSFFKKFWVTVTKNNYDALSKPVILATNWSSRMKVRIWRPSNTPALIFSYYNPGVMMCRKHSISESSVLTNWQFIKPNLMCRVKYDPISFDDWVVRDIWHTCFKGFTNRPVFLNSGSVSCSTVPHAELIWKLGETLILTKKEINHFQIYTYDRVLITIF